MGGARQHSRPPTFRIKEKTFYLNTPRGKEYKVITGIKPLQVRYDENGHRRMTFEPKGFKKYIQDNLGTYAPVVDDAGEKIGILPADAIWEFLVSERLV